MALRIRIERRRRPLERLFSFSSSEGNSSSNNNNGSKGTSSDPQPSSISSHFHDVKARLKQQQQPPEGHLLRRTPQPPPPTYYSRPLQQRQPPPRNSTESLEEIRSRLSEFRRRSAPPSPSSPSFQEIYQRNAAVAGRENESVPPYAAKISLDKIRESLRGISDRGNVNAANGPGLSGVGSGDRMSLSKFTDSLRLRPVEGDDAGSSKSAGGVGKGGSLPLAIFGREMREKNGAKGGKESDSLARTQLLRSYDYEELGEKLRNLRDVDGGKKGFSLEELNERLVRLREEEEKEMESRSQNNHWSDLRETLSRIKISEDEKSQKNTLHRLDLLGTLCGTPGYMHHPPKEHLVEKYFHPDNMSSAEKLKIQLAKVRDEFKMSESDCGSARVQVALLTTKIKHLSSVLHKKDKHSRKGLEGMVQRRKRLLKYLRNTDWDSYTMILARLGLRDNAELRR